MDGTALDVMIITMVYLLLFDSNFSTKPITVFFYTLNSKIMFQGTGVSLTTMVCVSLYTGHCYPMVQYLNNPGVVTFNYHSPRKIKIFIQRISYDIL